MSSYTPPMCINKGYLLIPEFLAEYLQKKYALEDHEMNGVQAAFENEELKYPFVELALDNETSMPDIVKQLTSCRIPYHFTYVYQEDMEINYWQCLSKVTEDTRLGFDTSLASTNRPILELDIQWLNNYLTTIKAQLNLMSNDAEALLDARDIYDADK